MAGKLIDRGIVTTFTCGRSYLERTRRSRSTRPELPLERGEQRPRSGCCRAASPTPVRMRGGSGSSSIAGSGPITDLSPLVYLLGSGSDRIGALDFQALVQGVRATGTDQATLEELVRAMEHVERGEPRAPALDRVLLHGSSIGGARPKALL
ncbi:MAG: hypothetical protein U5R31_06530 [Acidimicrobiia bacterium]|nr:hypothetical protein [Acidimicrobiia bacterium]